MDDKPKEIVAPDKGTRADDALKREVTIRVVPKSLSLQLPVSEGRVGVWCGF